MQRSPKTIPLVKPDLPPFAAVADQLREVLESGRVTNFGTYVRAFEQEASAYLGTHTATVSSNTIGLILALQALGVRGGERVILPSFTFAATAQAVLYAGGRPVFVEIDADFNVSLEDLDALLARYPDVRVVLPVHCYGLPCRVGDIQRIVDDAARRASHPIRVLYDAAHALGSATEGRLIGGSGDVEVFSLSATKTVVAMEGGLVSSRDPELVRSIRRMRNYGLDAHYEAGGPGLNGKMTEMQAIIGQYDLRRLGTLMEQRQLRARLYRDRILSEARSRVTAWPPATAHTFKDFTIILPDDLAPQRPSIVGFLRQQGIETRTYFCPPVHEQRYFRQYAERALPRTESLARRVLTLPFYAGISEEDIDYVVAALRTAERLFAASGTV